MQAPVDSHQERHLVLVDLVGAEAADLAPRARGVVAVLQILGGEDEGRQEHAAPALQGARSMALVRLLHCEVEAGDVGLDEDEVVERYLERGVAGLRPPQGLLDEGAQGEDAFGAHLATAHNGRKGPYRFNDLGGGI